MKLTKTKLKQLIKETMEEGGLSGDEMSANALNDAKAILFDEMKVAREGEQYDVARHIEEAISALQHALSIMAAKKYNR